jgi:ABC-type branched-subunit amino acid transport system ATPase component
LPALSFDDPAPSGGQQQMLVLAQSIDHPRYLLADELSFGLATATLATPSAAITCSWRRCRRM